MLFTSVENIFQRQWRPIFEDDVVVDLKTIDDGQQNTVLKRVDF